MSQHMKNAKAHLSAAMGHCDTGDHAKAMQAVGKAFNALGAHSKASGKALAAGQKAYGVPSSLRTVLAAANRSKDLDTDNDTD